MSLDPVLPWALLAVLTPLGGAILVFVISRGAAVLAALVGLLTTLFVIGSVAQTIGQGPTAYVIAGWSPPLGIALVNDGIAAIMMAMTAVVFVGAGLAGRRYVQGERAVLFWILFLGLWASLNAHFLSGDLFNLYVTLELVGLSAVALTGFTLKPAALRAALNYLYVSLAGSLFYLLGVALLYRAYGALDIRTVASLFEPDLPSLTALGLMTFGLLLKTALFPFHFWLPNAHANAAAPVSALLSAVVVKAAFYLILRLWLEFAPPPIAFQCLAVLGGGAILWGSIGALRAPRLKSLIAYSTVAQLGYLFLAFPLLLDGLIALEAILLFALAHAVAKAAMFIAAGDMMAAAGHDRLSQLKDPGRRMAPAKFAFAIAGVSIIGLPPTGGFVAKWLILTGSIDSGAWPITAVLIIGSLSACR